MSVSEVRLHRRAWLAGAGAALCLRGSAQAAETSQRHPFVIDDYLKRQSLMDVAFSASGDLWAALIQRPLAEGGFFAQGDTVVVPRCDVWLPGKGGGLERLTDGRDWALSPVFSPTGSRLAVPRIDRTGHVRLEIYALPSRLRLQTLPLPSSLDVAVRFFQGDLRPACVLWLCDNRLLTVTTPGFYRPRAINSLDTARQDADLAALSSEGLRAVRRWRTDYETTCGAGGSVVEYDLLKGQATVRAKGDIRAVSVSPDLHRLAVVRAQGRPPLQPQKPMPASLGETSGGYEDTFVKLKLDLVTLPTGTLETTDFTGYGNQPQAFAPVWSDDGKRFAVPHRTAYSSDPVDSGVWLNKPGGTSVLLAAPTPLDAVVSAHLCVADPAERGHGGLDAPVVFGNPTDPLGRALGGRVHRVGDQIIVSTGTRVSLLTGEGRVTLSMDRVDPESLACGGNAATFVQHLANKTIRVTVTSKGVAKASEHGTEEGRFESVFRHPRRPGWIAFEDASEATRLIEGGTSEARPQVIYTCNRHMAQVRVPRGEPIDYRGPEGTCRTGVLYWPTSIMARADRPRVIVYAYPQYTPNVRSRLGRPNSPSAWAIQALLATGFAVFHAAFPVENAIHFNGPFHRVAEEILPALDSLDLRSDLRTGTYGFYGHSNGGYAALALGAQTDRFKAIVAAAPFPDSIDTNLSVTPEIKRLDCAPFIVQMRRMYLEAPHVPYAYATDPVSGAERFLSESPLYNLERYTTPTLLLYGENDVSLPAVEKMFLALQARGVPAELDTYWGDGHVLSSPGNIRDATRRQVEWFQRWL